LLIEEGNFTALKEINQFVPVGSEAGRVERVYGGTKASMAHYLEPYTLFNRYIPVCTWNIIILIMLVY
jgi:hypothetical protein